MSNIKLNQNVTIYDDGKRGRGTHGKVIHIIDDNNIVVQFDPYGYPDEKDTILVFYKDKYGNFYTLNPRSKYWMEHRNYNDSEFCLIAKDDL